MSPATLGLSAAICWGCSGFIGGLAARQSGAVAVAAGSQLAGLVALAVALAATGASPPAASALVPALVGGLAGAVGLVCLMRALAAGPMGVVAPIAATGAAVPLAAGLLLGERPDSAQAAGMALALAGIVLVARGARSEGRPGARTLGGTVALAIAAALLFGGFYVGLRFSGRHAVLYSVASARASSVAFLLAWLATRPQRRRGTPRTRAAVVASGLLDVSGNAVFTLATTRGLLSLVAVLAALYPIVTVLCARIVLAERLPTTQRLGSVAAACGVILMAVR